MGDSGIDRRGHRGSCLQAHQQVTQGGWYDWKSVNYGRTADPCNRQGLNKKQEGHNMITIFNLALAAANLIRTITND